MVVAVAITVVISVVLVASFVVVVAIILFVVHHIGASIFAFSKVGRARSAYRSRVAVAVDVRLVFAWPVVGRSVTAILSDGAIDVAFAFSGFAHCAASAGAYSGGGSFLLVR